MKESLSSVPPQHIPEHLQTMDVSGQPGRQYIYQQNDSFNDAQNDTGPCSTLRTSPAESGVGIQAHPLLDNDGELIADSQRSRVEHRSRVSSVSGPHFDAPPAPSSRPIHAKLPTKNIPVGPPADISAYGLHKYTLYETASWYYIVGSDVAEKRYRVLKIDRTVEDDKLSLIEDKTVYNQQEMIHLLDAIDDGNRGTGGVKSRCTTWGLLGFIKFTGPYYMLLITKKSTVAILGGHYIYQVDGTELIPLIPARAKPDMRHNVEESRFLSILGNLDLTRSFYYSHSYDITRTLQRNMAHDRHIVCHDGAAHVLGDLNSMFVWNSHLLRPATELLKCPYDWCRPVIHGYVDQAAISVYGRTAHVTIIARRSRLFAGARFLKRGANDLGYVANDVETEQIVSDGLTTSFHAPGPRPFCSPQYTSYVQHRGSIPLYWSQDNTGVTPKPPIDLNLMDPFYGAAALHFDDLFERYGTPVYVLNLVKARERTPRESKLLTEFTNAINYLNQFLPYDRKILYRAWDMSRAAKSRDQDVIRTLESIAESVVTATGLFHNGDGRTSPIRMQNGIARTNCIDCLDRTNAAQFVVGKRALGHQLHSLGILGDTTIDYDTDAVNLFTHMYHDLGDTIAVQYGGSQLVNTMETYRKINQWTSHSRDMIESFRRYYNNSFLDGQRQEAYNLFLGNYIFTQGQPMLWDLATDYYLHHADPRTRDRQLKRGYVSWFTLKNLEPKMPPPCLPASHSKRLSHTSQPGETDNYWQEYYRPFTLSSFPKMFAYKMNSTLKYIPFSFKSSEDTWHDLSPFRIRSDGDRETDRDRTRDRYDPHSRERSGGLVDPRARLNKVKKEVMILDPASSVVDFNISLSGQSPLNLNGIAASLLSPAALTVSTKLNAVEDKANMLLKSFTKAVHESLNPRVSRQEATDYAQYIAHPQSLPLVVSTAVPAEIDTEYQEYISGSWRLETVDHDTNDKMEIDDADTYADSLKVGDNPLTVTEEDAQKKRYKAYRKWLSGKPLFKQLPIDTEQRDLARINHDFHLAI